MIVINARFLTQDITGVQRFAIEISLMLKKILKDNVIFASPENILHHKVADELDVEIIGNMKGHLWEQIDLPAFLKKQNNPLLLNLCNTAPMFYANKIVTVHDVAYERFSESFNWKFRLVYRLMVPRIIKRARHMFTVSEFSKEEINSIYKTPTDKISIIYNAVDNSFIPKKNNSIDDKYILAVSSLNYRKNFHSLVKAFNQLENDEVKLHLVGGIDKSFAKIELLNDIQENKNIVFNARVTDARLIELYSNALCFVYPSLYEGFGIPPLEAQACGCPVISSNVASLPEVGGDSFIYCDPYDINDIKEKMQSLIDNEDLQLEMKEKGFENIKRFSWENSAANILKEINKLI